MSTVNVPGIGAVTVPNVPSLPGFPSTTSAGTDLPTQTGATPAPSAPVVPFSGNGSAAHDLGLFAGAAVVFLLFNSFLTGKESIALCVILVLGALIVTNQGRILTSLTNL